MLSTLINFKYSIISIFISPADTLEVRSAVSKCTAIFAIDFYFYCFCVINFENVSFVLIKGEEGYLLFFEYQVWRNSTYASVGTLQV